ncbi:hypothetical protein Tco_1523250 [Tanacetum coccineum]
MKSASTPVDLEKPLVKDGDADDVDVHLYKSMIGSLMYLTASRPDIMFVVCACARFQVTPKTSHLLAIKRIFRYLKGKPTLGLWYSRDSPYELVAYTDSDYARATQDRKSTTGDCQFLGNRLISWQCKKQTVVATSTTEAEYVAAAKSKTSRHVKRGQDTKIPQSSSPSIKVGDEVVHKELGDIMEMVATTAYSLEAEQDSAIARTTDDGEVEITASIDGQVKTIIEASLRRHLKLETPIPSSQNNILYPSLSPQTLQSSPLKDITRQAAEIPHQSDSLSYFKPKVANIGRLDAFRRCVLMLRMRAANFSTDIGLEDSAQCSGTIHKNATRRTTHGFTLSQEFHILGHDKGSSATKIQLMDLYLTRQS